MNHHGKYAKVRVYNTAGRRFEEFVPQVAGRVGMYVCGPTVYDDCHLGHARAMVAFDLIYRWLAYRGYEVTYVRNITDIDDKIIARAAERGISWRALADCYIKEFHADMRKLSLLAPTVEPRATTHIDEMIGLIAALLEKELAYEVEGDVYFEVSRFNGYGALSGREPGELLAGARVAVDERKRSPLDFALWKRAKEGEPSWPSPWGKGRPGWHIECSAMAGRYFGETFDIHGGGQDLIFPHHENEIAQMKGKTGKTVARYWLHNAHVTINREKMSKSLGNFFTLKELYDRFEPRVIRFFLLRVHYRTPIDFSDRSLAEASAALTRLDECVARVKDAIGELPAPAAACPAGFETAMDNDFNTTGAIGVLFSLAGEIHATLDGRGDGWKENVRVMVAGLLKCLQVVGVEPAREERLRVEQAARTIEVEEIAEFLSRDGLSMEEVEQLLEARNEMRRAKNFKLADRIRDRIQEMGYEIRDEKGGGATVRRVRRSPE